MALPTVTLGEVEVSKFILGGNPFSGFSHQGTGRDREMLDFYTAEAVKAEFRKAEAQGVTVHFGRADHHVMRVLREYWNEGGAITWFAQTCPELGSISKAIDNAIAGGAKGCYIHGGQMDHLLGANRLDEALPLVEKIRNAGLAAGIAGHNPWVFDWAEEVGLPVDFYMCCYYNPTSRADNPEHVHGAEEKFRIKDRDAMMERIHKASKPVVHYKILAAGRTPAREAFAYTARHMRPQDAVCVGIFAGDDPAMLEEDLSLLEEFLDGE